MSDMRKQEADTDGEAEIDFGDHFVDDDDDIDDDDIDDDDDDFFSFCVPP